MAATVSEMDPALISYGRVEHKTSGSVPSSLYYLLLTYLIWPTYASVRPQCWNKCIRHHPGTTKALNIVPESCFNIWKTVDHHARTGCLLLHFSDKTKENIFTMHAFLETAPGVKSAFEHCCGLLVRESGLPVLIAFVNMLFFMSMKVFKSPESWGVGNIDDVLSVQLLY